MASSGLKHIYHLCILCVIGKEEKPEYNCLFNNIIENICHNIMHRMNNVCAQTSKSNWNFEMGLACFYESYITIMCTMTYIIMYNVTRREVQNVIGCSQYDLNHVTIEQTECVYTHDQPQLFSS